MKHSRFIRTIAMVVACAMLPAMASAATIKTAYRDGSLNLRSGPGTGYKSLGYVKNGQHVNIVKYGDVWTKIQTDSGKQGYVKNLYIINGDEDYASGTSYFSSYTAYTTANVNFRAGAGTSNKSMGILKKGSKVKVHGKNGSWYLVENNKGTQGYVHEKYVSKKSSSSSSSSGSTSSSEATLVVTGSRVNMRRGGGMSYRVITTLKKGTQVEKLYRGNYWTKVQYKNYTGWIRNTYLR